jgi:hypothetical protein
MYYGKERRDTWGMANHIWKESDVLGSPSINEKNNV